MTQSNLATHRKQAEGRSGGLLLMRVLATCFSSLTMAACVGLPPQSIRPYISDLGAVGLKAGQHNGIYYLSTSSYLPGDEEKATYTEGRIYNCNFDEESTTIAILTPTRARAQAYKDVPEFACGVWRRSLTFMRTDLPIGEIAITLVPEGVSFENRSLSISPSSLELDFAIRDLTGRGNLYFLRYLARTLSHELLHIYSGVLESQATQRYEEASAYLFASCVELEMFGSTFGDITDAGATKGALVRQTEVESGLERDIDFSLAGALSAKQFFAKHHIGLPVTRAHSDARLLLEECNSRIAKLGGRDTKT